MKATVSLPRTAWSPRSGVAAGGRVVPEETPVAIVHDGATTAVMMATPADLIDLAVGFTLSEGVADGPADIRSVEIMEQHKGVEARVWLTAPMSARLHARRRHVMGATGCGLCGVDSLDEAVRTPPSVAHVGGIIDPEKLLAAMSALEGGQELGRRTRAVHAAAYWQDDGVLIIREDVGRHNALDKLIGACAARGVDASRGVLLLTSRVSVEMVQKACVLGAPVMCAVSAPTALAVRVADIAGMTLVAVARADGFEVFTHGRRIA